MYTCHLIIILYSCIPETVKWMLKGLWMQAVLNRVGYTPEISHGVLVEMAEHKKDLEKKTKPILDTLRSYQDLPPVIILNMTWIPLFFSIRLCCWLWDFHLQDKALAALAIEDKKRQYAAAEKYLEDVLQSALASSEWRRIAFLQTFHFSFTWGFSALHIKRLGNWDCD